MFSLFSKHKITMNNHLGKKKNPSLISAVLSNSEANARHLPVCNSHAGLNFMSFRGVDDRSSAGVPPQLLLWMESFHPSRLLTAEQCSLSLQYHHFISKMLCI